MIKEFLDNFIDILFKIHVRKSERIELLEFFDFLRRLNRDNIMIR
jgi:hypothetical protein